MLVSCIGLLRLQNLRPSLYRVVLGSTTAVGSSGADGCVGLLGYLGLGVVFVLRGRSGLVKWS